MEYEPILEAVGEEPRHLFKTERGSAYAQYGDQSSIRNRSGEGHTDKTVGLQPRTFKTFYVPSDDVDDMMRLFKNKEYATKIEPLEYNKKTGEGRVGVVALEDIKNSFFAPNTKAGEPAKVAPMSLIPKVGYAPVEIYREGDHVSPKGSKGEGVHFGTKITEVHANPSQLYRSLSAPISGRGGAGGMGGSMTSKLNPLSLQNLYAKGGSVKMPEDYSRGGWKLI